MADPRADWGIEEYTTTLPTLVFEYVDNPAGSTFFGVSEFFEEYDFRYYMYKLLQALDYAHSKGIMHRDIKAGNIMVDHKKRQLRLIDWGLA